VEEEFQKLKQQVGDGDLPPPTTGRSTWQDPNKSRQEKVNEEFEKLRKELEQ
jgi:hypothetical protein